MKNADKNFKIFPADIEEPSEVFHFHEALSKRRHYYREEDGLVEPLLEVVVRNCVLAMVDGRIDEAMYINQELPAPDTDLGKKWSFSNDMINAFYFDPHYSPNPVKLQWNGRKIEGVMGRKYFWTTGLGVMGKFEDETNLVFDIKNSTMTPRWAKTMHEVAVARGDYIEGTIKLTDIWI